jgi:hypothetical protein
MIDPPALKKRRPLGGHSSGATQTQSSTTARDNIIHIDFGQTLGAMTLSATASVSSDDDLHAKLVASRRRRLEQGKIAINSAIEQALSSYPSKNREAAEEFQRDTLSAAKADKRDFKQQQRTKGLSVVGMVSPLLEGHERTILAYLMNGHGGCREFLHRVAEKIFFYSIHATVLHAIRDVFDSGDEVNFVTVSNRLEKMGALAKCGGQNHIIEIATATTSAELAESALTSVLEAYAEREATKIGKQLQSGKISSDQATAALALLRRRDDAGISFRSPEQILAMPRNPHANFLGDRLLGVARSLVIAGIGGIGKSRLLLQLLIAFILQRIWCSIETHNTRGKRWMLVQTQNSADRLQDDLTALKKYAGDEWPLVDKNLIIHTLETDRDLMINLNDQRNAHDLERAIRDYDPIGVAFDPLNEIAIGDLSKDVDMQATCDAIGRISRAGNPERAIVIAAHAITGVAGMKKAFGFEAAGFGRGSKVLGFWTRAQINAFPATEDHSILGLTCGKLNDGKQFSPFAIRLDEQMIYQHEPNFDMDALREQLERGKREAPPVEETLRKVLEQGRQYEKSEIAKLIMKEKGFHKATAYRWVEKGEEMEVLHYLKKVERYELT